MRDYKTIFVGLDFSELDELTVRTAGELAQRFRAERLHLVHVVAVAPAWAAGPFDSSGMAFVEAFQAGLDAAESALERIRVPAAVRVTREVRAGPIARELAEAASAVKADLLIVGSHPRGRLGRFLLGSVASTLVRVSPCPVLVVAPDRSLASVDQVIAAIDASSISADVVEHAATFAKKSEGRLRVLSGFDLEHTLRRVAAFRGLSPVELIDTCELRHRAEIDAIVSRAGVEATVDVRTHRDPASMILETIEAIAPSLVVIGTSGHNAWERFFLGSTASRVLAEARCPVLVVPARAVTSANPTAANVAGR